MIYDIVVGVKLSEHHYRLLNFDRIEEDMSLVEKYEKLVSHVEQAMSTLQNIPNREHILSTLTYINTCFKDNMSDSDFRAISEGLDVIAYFGVEAHIMERADLLSSTVDDRAVRAYLINTNVDRYNHHTCPALGISSTDISMGSTSDIVVEALRSKIRLEPSLENIIDLDSHIRDWELMDKVGAGYEFDSDDLLGLIEDKGYAVEIYLSE